MGERTMTLAWWHLLGGLLVTVLATKAVEPFVVRALRWFGRGLVGNGGHAPVMRPSPPPSLGPSSAETTGQVRAYDASIAAMHASLAAHREEAGRQSERIVSKLDDVRERIGEHGERIAKVEVRVEDHARTLSAMRPAVRVPYPPTGETPPPKSGR
jgi:hypothetical protein